MKKTKRQPYRNTFSRLKEREEILKREYSDLAVIKRKAQSAIANADAEKEAAAELARKALEREDKAREYERASRAELERNNPYHPTLQQYKHIGDVTAPINIDILRYRISSPRCQWDDKTHRGAVRLIVGNTQTGKQETLGFAVSDRALFDNTDRDTTHNIIRALGDQIASAMLEEIRSLKGKI